MNRSKKKILKSSEPEILSIKNDLSNLSNESILSSINQLIYFSQPEGFHMRFEKEKSSLYP